MMTFNFLLLNNYVIFCHAIQSRRNISQFLRSDVVLIYNSDLSYAAECSSQGCTIKIGRPSDGTLLRDLKVMLSCRYLSCWKLWDYFGPLLFFSFDLMMLLNTTWRNYIKLDRTGVVEYTAWEIFSYADICQLEFQKVNGS